MAVKCLLQLLNLRVKIATGAVIGTFTVRNEHGLHARPSAVLVNEVKNSPPRLRYKILLEKPHQLVRKV